MQPIQHQMMGYDRAITMFSPDGRLLQVEYAKKTVRLGNTAIGMVCKDGVLLVTDKRIVDKLVVPEAIEKIFKVDDHIMATAAGIISDARVLVEQGQVRAQQHRVTYDSPIDIVSVVKTVCDLKQLCTQSGGLRPFGVSLLIAGIDEGGKKLFETDPTGIFYQYKASVIGEGEPDIEEFLHKEYKDNLTIEEGLKLCIKALKKVLDSNFEAERIDAAYIDEKDKLMKKVDKERIKKLL
ncbi:MAG TPA: archaeal proteasome endopeptidase complex subunit alpha [Candidatus Nanoarchaeia archaeon]|nr:archaeal proteasome endopeptidase complex subunit alpha [Candidatus Nanoarchaeia archaeon]